MQTAQCKWRNASGLGLGGLGLGLGLGLGSGLGFGFAICVAPLVLRHLHCAVCIAPNTESQYIQAASLRPLKHVNLT